MMPELGQLALALAFCLSVLVAVFGLAGAQLGRMRWMAALDSLVLGKFLEAGAILAIVVLFGLLGFYQEYRAERAIAALKKLAVPVVRVRRDGQLSDTSARELVPGDLVALEAGNVVPADVRLVTAVNLRIQESALTGESEPVEKAASPLPAAEMPLGDRINMGYLGTIVTYGRGQAIVVETGMHTELGRIASLIQAVTSEPTPLQQRLDAVGKLLAAVGLAVAVLILILGVLDGESPQDMVLTAISVAVAVIPEGLPAVLTFTLALGAQRMLRRNALIRKLPAVETLGSVTTICTDKTGTLTENRMTVTVIEVAGERLEIEQALRRGHPSLEDEEGAAARHTAVAAPIGLVLAGGALCNDATLTRQPEGSRVVATDCAWASWDTSTCRFTGVALPVEVTVSAAVSADVARVLFQVAVEPSFSAASPRAAMRDFSAP